MNETVGNTQELTILEPLKLQEQAGASGRRRLGRLVCKARTADGG